MAIASAPMLTSRLPMASRARSVVGLTSSPRGATSLRPLAVPATTLIDGMLTAMPFDIDMDWSLEPPGLVARFTPGPQHHGPADNLHGGIAALILDWLERRLEL